MGNPVAEPTESGSRNEGSKEWLGRETEPDLVQTENHEFNRPGVSVPMSNNSSQKIRSQSRSKDRNHNSKGQTWTMTS